MKKTLLFFNLFAFGFSATAARMNIENLNLKDMSVKALEYALANQKQAPDQYYLKGEWPTQIQSTMVPALVGVGTMFGQQEEASAFTTAAVINVLAQTYVENKELQKEYPLNQVPSAISNGVDTLGRYQQGATYNFYPARIAKGVEVRRPISMTLFPIWHGFTNIPNDSDTSSSVFSALIYNAQINGGKYRLSKEVIGEFTSYRDIGRNPQFYNRRNNLKDTGAFMTWLYDESNPKMPRNYFSSSTKGERIPFNRNDVDCIVNTNVLRMLALAGQKNTPGLGETCNMLNRLIEQDEHKDCGVYYPNTLNLSYAIAASEKAGVTCISDRSHELIINKIISMQQADGSWLNEGNIWQDPTLTTAFAMYSLLHFANPHEPRIHSALVYGAHSLLKSVRQKNGMVYWDADNFFTATAIARSLIMWRSKAYTNGIIAAVFLKMHKEFPTYKNINYLKLKMGDIQ